MKTRKIMALLLSVIMLVTLMAACGPKDEPTAPPAGNTGSNTPDAPPPASPPPQGQQPGQTAPPPEAPPEPVETPPANINSKTPRDTFVVGTPAMNGDFINGFGNSSYDKSIKVLLGHYEHYSATYYQTPEGEIALNPTVVQNITTSVDAVGNKTYTIDLWNDLKWSDGRTINAKDFVGCLLLYASPEFAAVGVSSSAGDGLIGNDEYRDGDTNYFAGAKVLGEFKFSLTISADELPYFWETAFCMMYPIPMHVWLPGIDIITDANGSCFSGDISELCQVIAETERYAPSVSSGPYMFVDFDGTTVRLQRNPYFKGDPHGNLPTFEFVVQMEVPSETDVDMVIGGDLDFNAGNIEGEKIEAARASEFAVAHSYLRAGYGYVGFHCDWGVAADPNVRWAISCIIDRNAVIDHVLGGYGGLVDACFGMAQWTFQARRRELSTRLTPIAFNLDKANDFLDLTEWVFEADGRTPFDRTKTNADGTYMRHNAAGEMLVIRHLSASSVVGGVIESETLKNGPLVGMKYEVTHGDFNALLDNYYYGFDLGDDRYYNSYNLATNFSAVDDKYWASWHSDMLGTWMNSEQYATPEMDALIMQMRSLDPTDTDTFADLWVEFMVAWQQGLPQIPLYSNEYFDIYNTVVKSVPTSPYASYEEVICMVEKWP